MKELTIILNDASPADFYGIGNCNLQMLRSLYPKVRFVGRDNVLKLYGDESELRIVKSVIEGMEAHLYRHNKICHEDILEIYNGRKPNESVKDDVIIYNMSGRPIIAKSENQRALVSAFENKDIVFAVGPAGTGKTYLGIALAVRLLKSKCVKRIILSRPAVEAGEKLGFLPGDMRDKIDPYLQPLYDALEDMIPSSRLHELIERKVIEIAPLAFMRGRTLSDAVVILDEAQNTTRSQFRMFITRMGWNTKMIITGDTQQTDLPRNSSSGLVEALETLSDIDDIAIVRMSKKDIQRHHLVNKIVAAYERKDETEKNK
ncbi:MAG: PhoH family protein [Bacteroidaceae bacterium]|nr:PhoH family protein [Bacteroidaceae bacterium]